MTTRDTPTRTRRGPLPAVRMGLVSGITGILCCVGPAVLALIGAVSGATAVTWGDELYDGYAWWFRLAGLVVLAGLVWWALRHRDQCSVDGVRRAWPRLLLALGVAVVTYVVLYAATAGLTTFA